MGGYGLRGHYDPLRVEKVKMTYAAKAQNLRLYKMWNVYLNVIMLLLQWLTSPNGGFDTIFWLPSGNLT